MTKREEQKSAVVEAAYRVATFPTAAAYSSGSARKGVAGRLLRDLIEALAVEGLLGDEGRDELALRLDALDRAKAASDRWWAEEDARQAARDATRETAS